MTVASRNIVNFRSINLFALHMEYLVSFSSLLGLVLYIYATACHTIVFIVVLNLVGRIAAGRRAGRVTCLTSAYFCVYFEKFISFCFFFLVSVVLLAPKVFLGVCVRVCGSCLWE